MLELSEVLAFFKQFNASIAGRWIRIDYQAEKRLHAEPLLFYDRF